MEASGYQAKKHGLYPKGARLLVKILVGMHVCMHVWAGVCSSTCVKGGRMGMGMGTEWC